MNSYVGIVLRNIMLKTRTCPRCGTLYASSKIRLNHHLSSLNFSTDYVFHQYYFRTLLMVRPFLKVHNFWTSSNSYEPKLHNKHPKRLRSTGLSTRRSNNFETEKLNTAEVLNGDIAIRDLCKKTNVKMERKKGYLFSDRTRSGDVAGAILTHRKYKDSVIIEISPGHGILTEALLEGDRKIKKYIAVEGNDSLRKSLEESLQLKKYGSHLLIRKGTLLNNQYSPYAMKKFDKREKEILEKDVGVGENKHLTFVGPMLEPFEYTVSDLVHKLADRQGILNNFTPEYFFFVSPYLCRKLRNTELSDKQRMFYKAFSVMVHQLFEYNFIAKVPLSSLRFSPTNKKFIELKCPDEVITANHGYLLHLVPRRDVIQGIDNVNCFYKFLQQNLSSSSKKADRFIPKMCALFPDCGIHLIRLGITMMDRIIDISPQQYLQIYQEMKTWPGYEDSALYSVITEEDSAHKTSLEDQLPFSRHPKKL